MTPLMLPAAPKDVGRLSDVFISALASVSGGGENRLRLPKVKHSIVILVDGLGFENLQSAPAYARFLNKHLDASIRCEFPSTTATSISGFATGVRSNEHGLIGYSAFDRNSSEFLNLLTGWSSRAEAENFKLVPTVAEAASGVGVFSVGPKTYENSGFTALTMSGATYLAAERISDRFEVVEKVIREQRTSLSYLYVPELDQLAHKHGVESNEWLHALEELDLVVNRFCSKLNAEVGVIVTADHGVLDVPHEQHVYLEDLPWYRESVTQTTGDPRCNFVYLKPGIETDDFENQLQTQFGDAAYICKPGDLVEVGWMGQFDGGAKYLLPDLYIIWRDKRVSYDRRTSKPSHLKLIGQHGGISDAETRVPLIKLGKY